MLGAQLRASARASAAVLGGVSYQLKGSARRLAVGFSVTMMLSVSSA